MTAYLTREAAEALHTRLSLEPQEADERGEPMIYVQDVRDLIDSLPIVGAVPAEEALDAIAEEHDELREAAEANPSQRLSDIGAAYSIVRHALRAATRCPTCGVATVPLESGATAIIGRPVVTLTGTQAQADAAKEETT